MSHAEISQQSESQKLNSRRRNTAVRKAFLKTCGLKHCVPKLGQVTEDSTASPLSQPALAMSSDSLVLLTAIAMQLNTALGLMQSQVESLVCAAEAKFGAELRRLDATLGGLKVMETAPQAMDEPLLPAEVKETAPQVRDAPLLPAEVKETAPQVMGWPAFDNRHCNSCWEPLPSSCFCDAEHLCQTCVISCSKRRSMISKSEWNPDAPPFLPAAMPEHSDIYDQELSNCKPEALSKCVECGSFDIYWMPEAMFPVGIDMWECCNCRHRWEPAKSVEETSWAVEAPVEQHVQQHTVEQVVGAPVPQVGKEVAKSVRKKITRTKKKSRCVSCGSHDIYWMPDALFPDGTQMWECCNCRQRWP